jgi:hypothetical protein
MSRRDPVIDLYRQVAADIRKELAERTALVLGYDDLAKRLTMPPLDCAEPKRWNGFIPPYMIEGPCESGRNTWKRNPSPVRVHLVAICHEAYARAYGEDVGHAWLEEINTNRWTDDWSPTDAMARAGQILDRSAGRN